jgi:hypothetical protein
VLSNQPHAFSIPSGEEAKPLRFEDGGGMATIDAARLRTSDTVVCSDFPLHPLSIVSLIVRVCADSVIVTCHQQTFYFVVVLILLPCCTQPPDSRKKYANASHNWNISTRDYVCLRPRRSMDEFVWEAFEWAAQIRQRRSSDPTTISSLQVQNPRGSALAEA